jgi:hypothetical protein
MTTPTAFDSLFADAGAKPIQPAPIAAPVEVPAAPTWTPANSPGQLRDGNAVVFDKPGLVIDARTQAFVDVKSTLAGEVGAARRRLQDLEHFKSKRDPIMYSEAKERAAVQRLADAVKAFDEFVAANPGLPS